MASITVRSLQRCWMSYGIEMFPTDILSFLEESVHVLEAISDVARLKGREELAKRTDEHIRLIER